VKKSTNCVIPSEDFMILWLTTVHENAGSAGILPAVAGHRAVDDVAGRMPALPFSWQRGISLCLLDFYAPKPKRDSSLRSE
jgi:hypothetical protein